MRRWFYQWRDNGLWLWLSLNNARQLMARETTGREDEEAPMCWEHSEHRMPSAVVIDSQSAKTMENGGPRAYNASKNIKGRKRHILTDTEGSLAHAVIHTADIHDRNGAPLVLAEIIRRFP